MFIVIYDDDDCLCIPQSWDSACVGAICSGNRGDTVAMFESRAAARRAIDISAKFAALCKSQGKPANEDFIGECRKNIRVVPLIPNKGPKS